MKNIREKIKNKFKDLKLITKIGCSADEPTISIKQYNNFFLKGVEKWVLSEIDDYELENKYKIGTIKDVKFKNATPQEIRQKCCDHWYQLYEKGPLKKESQEFLENYRDDLIKAPYWGSVGIKTALLNTEDTYKCVYCRKEIKR